MAEWRRVATSGDEPRRPTHLADGRYDCDERPDKCANLFELLLFNGNKVRLSLAGQISLMVCFSCFASLASICTDQPAR